MAYYMGMGMAPPQELSGKDPRPADRTPWLDQSAPAPSRGTPPPTPYVRPL